VRNLLHDSAAGAVSHFDHSSGTAGFGMSSNCHWNSFA
jgi:hypothetical protein